MRDRRRWAELVYGRIVALYPSRFREQYGHEVEMVFKELLDDPDIPAWRLWLAVLRDLPDSVLREHLTHLKGGPSMGRSWLPDRVVLRRGAIVGCAILVVWVTFRGFHIGALIDQSPLPHDIASVLWVPLLLSPLLLFGPAGFLGARRTGTLGGGLWAGLVTGLIASLTVPGDYLMRHFWIASLPDAFFTYAITAVVCMVVAGLGAAVAVLLSKGSRGRLAGWWAIQLHWLADRLAPHHRAS